MLGYPEDGSSSEIPVRPEDGSSSEIPERPEDGSLSEIPERPEDGSSSETPERRRGVYKIPDDDAIEAASSGEVPVEAAAQEEENYEYTSFLGDDFAWVKGSMNRNHLSYLRMERMQLGNKGTAAVARELMSAASPCGGQIKALYLGENDIGDDGARFLAETLLTPGALPRLRKLYMQDNKKILRTTGHRLLHEACSARGIELIGLGSAPPKTISMAGVIERTRGQAAEEEERRSTDGAGHRHRFRFRCDARGLRMSPWHVSLVWVLDITCTEVGGRRTTNLHVSRSPETDCLLKAPPKLTVS